MSSVEKVVFAILAVVLSSLVALGVVSVRNYNKWAASCEAQGNHVVSLSKSALCVTPDGRIVE